MAKQEITYLIIFGTIVFMLLLIFVVIILISFYNKNRNYRIHLLKVQHEKEQELLKSQLEIQEQTFRNISQEIHDNIGQVLSLAKLNLNTMHVGDPDNGKDKISN